MGTERSRWLTDLLSILLGSVTVYISISMHNEPNTYKYLMVMAALLFGVLTLVWLLDKREKAYFASLKNSYRFTLKIHHGLQEDNRNISTMSVIFDGIEILDKETILQCIEKAREEYLARPDAQECVGVTVLMIQKLDRPDLYSS